MRERSRPPLVLASAERGYGPQVTGAEDHAAHLSNGLASACVLVPPGGDTNWLFLKSWFSPRCIRLVIGAQNDCGRGSVPLLSSWLAHFCKRR